MELYAQALTKSFSIGKPVVDNVNFTLASGDSLAVTGKNGSGKSTLLKLIIGSISPTKGEIVFAREGKEILDDDIIDYFSFVAPYLILYEEFSPCEHFKVSCSLSGIKANESISAKFEELMREFAIYHAMDREIRLFSSGMKQRMKFVLALLLDKSILILDEPFTNLDVDGITIVEKYMLTHLQNNGILIVASNDKEEYKMCNQIINLT